MADLDSRSPTGRCRPVTAARAAPASPTAAATAGVATDWSAQAADAVDLTWSTPSTTRLIRPVILGARAVVFGLLVAALATVVMVVLVSVSLVRLLDVYVFGGRVWASYLLLGRLFTVGGLVAWSPALRPTRRPPPAAEPPCPSTARSSSPVPARPA